MASSRLRFALPLVLVTGLVSAPRLVRADLVEDPVSRASFWAPDGWVASSQTRGAWKLFLRRAADEKAMCGMAIAKAPGTLDWALESVEAIWKQGPERYERLTKGAALVAGTAGLRAEHRITIPAEGRTLRALTVVTAVGEWRIALWAAHEAGLETAYAPIVRRIEESIVLPAAAPAAGPGAPVLPPAPSAGGAPSSSSPQGAGLLFDPRFREGRAADVLVAGDDPLLRGAVDAFIDLVEAATDNTLSEADEQALRDGVEADWKKATAEDRLLIDGSVATRERLRAAVRSGDSGAARAVVGSFTDEVSVRAAAKPTGGWQAVVRRAGARKLEAFTASGDPVVSLAAVDSLEELVLFYVGLARNDGARVTNGQRLAVRAEKVRPAIEGADPARRRHFAAMRRFWALVKARWDAADADTKLRLRWSATDLARAVAKLPEAAADMKAEGLEGYARAATQAAAALPVFEAYTNVFANFDAVVESLVTGFGMAKTDVDVAFATEPITLR